MRRMSAECVEKLQGLPPEVTLLSDRRLPGLSATVRHLAVGPSGVWVVDAHHYTGQVTIVDRGDWVASDMRLLVGGRDRTRLVHELSRKAAWVSSLLADRPEVGDVHAALCFMEDQWDWSAAPAFLGEVLVATAGVVVERAAQPGDLAPEARAAICETLARACPPG